LGTSLSAEGERFVFSEDEARSLRFLNCGLCLERRYATGRGRRCFAHDIRWWQLELNLLPVTGADLDEGVQRARSDVEADSLLEQPGDFPIRPALAAEFPDQFAVRFEL